MGDLIHLVRVVTLETTYDKSGVPSIEEKIKMQRSDNLESLEIDYDESDQRRLVSKVN